jgi:hypothetical protein
VSLSITLYRNVEDLPEIYTTGAYLRPLEIINEEGEKIYIWYVSKFESDSFYDGETCDSKECANSKEGLLMVC